MIFSAVRSARERFKAEILFRCKLEKQMPGVMTDKGFAGKITLYFRGSAVKPDERANAAAIDGSSAR